MDLALNQTAVYWQRGDPDGYGGYDWEDPVEIDCRWESSTELFVDSQGEERRSRAKVFLGQDVEEGGYLYLGDLDDLTSSSDPGNISRAYRIQRSDKIPDLSGAEFLRRAWL
jgi:hypothetical protein